MGSVPAAVRGEPGHPTEKTPASRAGEPVTADGLPRGGPDGVPLVWAFIQPVSHSLEDVFWGLVTQQ